MGVAVLANILNDIQFFQFFTIKILCHQLSFSHISWLALGTQVRDARDGFVEKMMIESEIHEGGCHCGAVRFRTHGVPVKSAVCHCRYCQLRTGSAFGVSAYFPNHAVELLQGELKSYTFQTESGREFTTKFCPACATTLFWSLGMTPELTGVAAGTFDPPSFWFNVSREIFTRSAAHFVHTDLPEKHETTGSYAPVQRDKAALAGDKNG